MRNRKNLEQVVLIVLSIFLAMGSITVALAWTGPSVAAPNGNVSPDINTGATGQNKAGPFGVNGGYSLGYPFSVSNAGFASWTAIFNWPYNTATGYGILVGSSASGYSLFENGSGYYTNIAQSSWGVYTNGNISGAAYYVNGNRFYGFGGIYDAQGAGYMNPITGARSCPAGYSAYPFLNDYTGCCNPYTFRTLYQCYQ